MYILVIMGKKKLSWDLGSSLLREFCLNSQLSVHFKDLSCVHPWQKIINLKSPFFSAIIPNSTNFEAATQLIVDRQGLGEWNLPYIGKSESIKCFQWPMKNCYCSSSLLSKMLLISPRLRLGLLYLLGLNSAGCLGLHHDKSEANRTEKCELILK